MRTNDPSAAALRGRFRRAAISLLMLGVFAACTAAAMATDQTSLATGQTYKVAGTFGKEGTGNGQWSNQVTGLATDAAGNVYVSDGNLSRIQAFSAKGAFLRKYVIADGGGITSDVAVGPTGDVFGATQVGGLVRRFPKAGGAPETLTSTTSADGIAVDADGNVYASGGITKVFRFDKTDTGWAPPATWVGSGFQWALDVEASPDGTIYVADIKGSPPNVKRYDASGKLLNRINMKMQATAGAGVQLGIGVDPDCNVWATNNEQRNLMLYSASGKLLATATSGDMLAKDVAVAPNGDVYTWDVYTKKVIRFTPDRSKPAAAIVQGKITVSGGKATVRYTLSGVSCPSQLSGVASLSGAVTGKAPVKVAAGKTTVLTIPARGKSGKAQFKIVLKTNGRPTTQMASVNVTVR